MHTRALNAVFYMCFLHIQPPSTDGDTAALLHPPPVPQSDAEQQETELVGQIVAESKDVPDGERETGPLQEPDETPYPKAGTVTPAKEEERTQDEGVQLYIVCIA